MDHPKKSTLETNLESEIAWSLDGRRLTVFHILWVILTIGGGALIWQFLVRKLASLGFHVSGRLGQYAAGVFGFVMGLAIAGFCAWLLFGFVMWLGLGWIVRQKRRRGE